MRRWDIAGLVALIIAAALALGWTVAVIALVVSDETISDEGMRLISGLGQVLAGALATYLGFSIRDRARTWPDRDEDKRPVL